MATISESVTVASAAQARLKGVLLIALGAFAFSLAPIFSRAIDGYSTATIAFYRAAFAAIGLGLLTATTPARRAEADPRRWAGRVGLLVVLLGVLMGLTSFFYTHAYLHTTVAKAVLLNYTAPVYVTLLGPLLLREARSRWAWPAVALGFGGIVLIADPARLGTFASAELLGIAAGAGSGVTFAGVFIIGRYLAGRIAPIARTLVCGLVMTVMFLPWGLMTPPELFWRNLPFVAGLGLFALALPYLLIFAGQRYVTAQVGVMVALFEPVCVVIIGYLLYQEHLSVVGMIGAAAILLSIYLTSQ